MPGQGRVVKRTPITDEQSALGNATARIGETKFDIYLNDRACWRNFPANVWSYKLGGYQVLKKWLYYRERGVLGRPLTPEETQHFTDTAVCSTEDHPPREHHGHGDQPRAGGNPAHCLVQRLPH